METVFNFYSWLARLQRPRVYRLLFALWSDADALFTFFRYLPTFARQWRGESRFRTGVLVSYYRGEAPEHFARKVCEAWGVPVSSDEYVRYVELARTHLAGHLGASR